MNPVLLFSFPINSQHRKRGRKPRVNPIKVARRTLSITLPRASALSQEGMVTAWKDQGQRAKVQEQLLKRCWI